MIFQKSRIFLLVAITHWVYFILKGEFSMGDFELIISKNKVLKDLFAHCPEEIINNKHLELYPEGVTLIEKGSNIDSVYILLSGGVDVFKDDDKFNELSFLSNEAPAFAGLLEALSSYKRANANVRTNSESLIAIYSAQDFIKWIESDFEIYKMIITIFTQDMYHTLSEKNTCDINHGKNFLMNYLSTTFRDEILLNGEIVINYSCEDLAKTLNMHPEYFHNNIDWLLRGNLISLTNGNIIINKLQLGRIESFLIHNSKRQ